MAVTAYVGLPRSGKSYQALEFVIVPACREGRPVYTNIPVYEEKLQQDFPQSQLNKVSTEWFEQDENLESIPGGALIVLDEAWRVFPSGQKQNGVSTARRSFFAEHGHRVGWNGRTQDIVLIVQCLTKIASWARADISKTFVSTKLDGAGMDKKFRIDIYQGPVRGPKYPAPDLGYSIQQYKPEFYQYYLSHTLGDGTAGLEVMTDKRATVFNHPAVKYGVPFSIVCIVLAGYFVIKFFSSHGKEKPKPVEQPKGLQAPPVLVPPSHQTVPVAAAPAVQSLPPKLSEVWRISGYYSNGEKTLIFITTGTKTRRLPASRCKIVYGEYECALDGELVTSYSGPIDEKKPFLMSDLNPIKEAKND